MGAFFDILKVCLLLMLAGIIVSYLFSYVVLKTGMLGMLISIIILIVSVIFMLRRI